MNIRCLMYGVLSLVLTLTPVRGWAQSATTGAIAGVVRDATGAVLPGVTVEAASPALIEKVRTAVTDAEGNYKIVDLRPGTYTVTFTLSGFSAFRREGIELTTGFTATANADLRVGSLEETVTVTGASPVVDVQNVRRQTVLSRTELDTLPTNKTTHGFATLTLGATLVATRQDVGGNKGEVTASFSIHGSRAGDSRMYMEGMFYQGIYGGGSASTRANYANQAFVQEVTLQTGDVESELGGVAMNLVPKDGGNVYSLYIAANGTGPKLQTENLSDEIRARGLTATPGVKAVWDLGGGMGGPIRQDKLWFYTAHRWWGAQEYAPGNFFNKTHGTMFYTPDFDRPAYVNFGVTDDSVRFTWQASSKDKIAVTYGLGTNCNPCYHLADANRSPDATSQNIIKPVHSFVGTWNRPATNRLLFEAGGVFMRHGYKFTRSPGVTETDIPIIELSTGFSYNAVQGGIGLVSYTFNGHNPATQANGRFSVSYVTGSHAFKTGMSFMDGRIRLSSQLQDPPVNYQFRFQQPVAIVQFASPHIHRTVLSPALGFYAQDQWTIRRLTLTGGLRFDYMRAYAPAEQIPAGPFVPALDTPRVDNIPRWTDVSPRLGGAFDLFGNGRTAVKASVGRFLGLETVSLAEANHPANRITTSATRTWADANQNYVPECDLKNQLANGECGQLSNLNLGRPIPTTNYSPDFMEGFGKRSYSWQANTSVQHELVSNMAITAGYYRVWYGNFTVRDNLAVTPENFSPYCITAPSDTRLGAVSGSQLCDLYDINPAQFGRVDTLVRLREGGEQTEAYNGFEVGLNARFGRGGLLRGGVSTGQTVFNNCTVVDSPQDGRPGFCNTKLPFEGQTQYKVAGAYPLPGDFLLSATFQNLPGIPIEANLVVPNAQIAPSLGRNLAAGAGGTATIALLEPNTQFEDRRTQVDVRATKIFRMGRTRLQGQFDVYNVFNASSVLSQVFAYGSAWRRPTAILGARLFKFGVQIDY